MKEKGEAVKGKGWKGIEDVRLRAEDISHGLSVRRSKVHANHPSFWLRLFFPSTSTRPKTSCFEN